jgi:trehalose 6-phosphate synthase/phosphatase
MNGSLLIVSNRLPLTFTKDPDSPSGWSSKLSSGGLVSALSCLKKMMKFVWIGWPGML